MKNIFAIAVLTPLLTLLFLDTASAQCFRDKDGILRQPDGSLCPTTISTAVPFLRIVPDARSGALGDAGLATTADPNAMHFNASKLVFAEKDLGISVTFTPWLRALGLNDVYMAYLTGYKKIDDLQAVGLGLRYFSLGSIQFTNEQGDLLNPGNPYEFEINLAYSRKLADKLAASVGAKFIFSDLASGQVLPGSGEVIEAGAAGAADIGFTYTTPVDLGSTNSDLRIGAAITNIGSKITYTNSINRDFLPANLGLGVGWEFNLDDHNSLTLLTDLNKLLTPTPQDDNSHRDKSVISGIFSSFSDAQGGLKEELWEINYSFGAEYWYDKQFAVRAGYFAEHETKGNRKYLTVGLGLKYNIFGLNLSYLVPTTNQQNPLDNTLRFTLMFDFGAFAADE
jgi:hypothetical protein